MWGILWTFIRCFVLHIPICTRFFLHICLKVKLVLLESLNYIDLQWLTHSIVYLPFQGLHCKVYHWFVTLFLFRKFSFEKLGVHYTAFILALGRQPSPKQRNNIKFMNSVLKYFSYFLSYLPSALLLLNWNCCYWLLCRNAREASEPHSSAYNGPWTS